MQTNIERALVLTWEYPPKVVGSIAPHCESLARGLARKKVAVDVVTFDHWAEGITKGTGKDRGITVHRAANPISPCTSTLTWALTAGVELERLAADVIHSVKGKVDIIHAHDWASIPAAVALRHEFEVPMVLTLHSTETHRSGKVFTPYLDAIRKIEWQGTFEAETVIVDTEQMREEVVEEYQIPERKVHVVEPGKRGWINVLLKQYREAMP